MGHVAHMGQKSSAYMVLVAKMAGKREFLRYKCRWKDNINMYLTGKDGTAGPGFIWFRTGTSSNEPLGSTKYAEFIH